MKYRNFFILLMCLVLTACGKSAGDMGTNNTIIGHEADMASGNQTLRTINDVREIILDEYFDITFEMIACETGFVVSGEKEGQEMIRIFPQDGNVSGATEIILSSENGSLSCIGEDVSGGFCALFTDISGNSVLISYDKKGNQQFLFQMPQTDRYIGALVISEEEVVAWTSQDLYLMRGNGKATRISVSQSQWAEISTVEQMEDGTLYVIFYDDSGMLLAEIDTIAQKIDSIKSCGGAPYRYYASITGNLSTPYLHTGQELRQVNDKGETLSTMGWEGGNINGEYLCAIVVQGNNSVVALPLSYEKNALYIASTEEKQVERQILTIGAMRNGASNVERLVGYFNSINEDYYAQIVYYDEPIQLATDLLSNNAPDVLEMTNVTIPLNDINFLDMTELMEKTPFITPEDFIGNTYQSLLIDGKILFLVDRISVTTATARSIDVGTSSGWTMSEFQNLMEKKGDNYAAFPAWLSPVEMLHWISFNAMSDYINYDNYSCDFENEGFISQLQLCKNQPDETSSFMLLSDYDEHILLHAEIISHPIRVSTIRQNYGIYDYTFIGFPNNRGANGSYLARTGLSTMLAIPSTSPDPEGAWQFICTMYDDSWQKNGDGLPIIKQQMEYLIQTALADNEGYFMEEDWHALLQLLQDTTDFVYQDQTISRIIEEEAQVYFADEIDGAEAVHRIQNRVSIYLDEISN